MDKPLTKYDNKRLDETLLQRVAKLLSSLASLHATNCEKVKKLHFNGSALRVLRSREFVN